jgi:hypothetical protein
MLAPDEAEFKEKETACKPLPHRTDSGFRAIPSNRGEHMGDTPQGAPARPLGWFAHLRALLVALHLVAITVLAAPSVGEGLSRWAWQDPTVQDEFADWTDRLNRWGVAITRQEFEDDLWEAATAYESLHGRALAPFWRYYEWCGTFQSWRMFAGPHRYPSRLLIDIEEGGAWRPVYAQRDPDHAWLAEQLDHYRMRPYLYRLSWYRYADGSGGFDQMTRWVAGHAAHDFPQAQRVRVRFFKFRTLSPEEVKAGRPVSGEFVPDVELDLGDLR